MKVTTKWSRTPLFVAAIHVPRLDAPFPSTPPNNQPGFAVLEAIGPSYRLTMERENECEIVDRTINDFVFVDVKAFDSRVVTFMWRPLAESGLWEDVWEHYPDALKALTRMVTDAGVA